jgi:ABC-type sugar transport system ATPase subunit
MCTPNLAFGIARQRSESDGGGTVMKVPTAVPIHYGTIPSINSIIQIQNGSFYRQHPSDTSASTPKDSNIALFPGLDFSLPAIPLRRDTNNGKEQQHWAVIGVSGTTTFLEILRGAHICIPPNARTYPYLSSDDIEAKDHRLRSPSRAIKYVGFTPGKFQGSGGGIRGSYLSARYESRREETDWSVLQYLKGETELNPSENAYGEDASFNALLSQVVKDLRLERLATMPVSNLSNGQTRRARIAKALLDRPEVLLLDEPFSGCQH